MSKLDPFFVVLMDRQAKTFDVFGPTTDDWPITQSVVELQRAGLSVHCCTRTQRSPRETKAMVVENVSREMGLQHRDGLLHRLRGLA